MDSEKASFLEELKQYLHSSGKNYPLYPNLAGKPIDLHELYHKVISYGGYAKVCKQELWEEFVYEKFNSSGASLSYGLRNLYHKYLEKFERINFFGEEELSRHHDSNRYRVFHDRNYSSLTWRKNKPTTHERSYSKLVHALISCLPNEVDFAINACTLLSGESRHVLRLPNCPHILDALLLHAGIVSDDVGSLKEIGLHWKKSTGHDFEKFWNETVSNRRLLEAIFPGSCRDQHTPPYNRNLLFRPSRAEGVQEYEGQRVLQIAMVLLNLSFEHFNVTLLAKNIPMINFVFLCLHSDYSALKQTGLDIFSNISVHIDLHVLSRQMNDLLYEFLLNCISSSDKFQIVRGFEILGNLCRRESNLNLMCVHLEDEVFTTAINSLVLTDIELVLASLEMLYRLTKLGTTDICTRLALINGSIDIFMCLVTLNVRMFRSESFANIRLARKIPPKVPSTIHRVPTATPDHTRTFNPSEQRHVVTKQPIMTTPRPMYRAVVKQAIYQPQTPIYERFTPHRKITSPMPYQPTVPQPTVPQPPVHQPPVHQPTVHQPPVHQPPIAHAPVHQPPVPQPPLPQPIVHQPSVPHVPVHQPSVPQPPIAHAPVPQPPVPHVPVPQPSVSHGPAPRVPVSYGPAPRVPQPQLPVQQSNQPPVPHSSAPYGPVLQPPVPQPPTNRPPPHSHPPTTTTNAPQWPTMVLSKPSGVGRMYTHSELRTAPPVFHYMPAPPSDIKIDQSLESFTKLWLWATLELCEDAEAEGMLYSNLYNEYKEAVVVHETNSNVGLESSPFLACLVEIFPKVIVRQSQQAANTNERLKGIKRRRTPLPVPGYQLRSDLRPSVGDKSQNLKRNHDDVIEEPPNKKPKQVDLKPLVNGFNCEVNGDKDLDEDQKIVKKKLKFDEDVRLSNGFDHLTNGVDLKDEKKIKSLEVSLNNKICNNRVLVGTAIFNGTNQQPPKETSNPIISVQITSPRPSHSRLPPTSRHLLPNQPRGPGCLPSPHKVGFQPHVKTQHNRGNAQIDLMAADASIMVLYRNCGKPDFTDFTDQNEDALSVSIRLTSTLILTNIAKFSEVGKSFLQTHKHKIIELSMSTMDCSPMLAKLLYELER